MKKWISFLLTFVMVVTFTTTAHANENADYYEIAVEPRIGEQVMLDINEVTQEETYYCGPACVQTLLQYFGISKTQDSLASEMGTIPGYGTSPAAITACLNRYLGSEVYTSQGTWNHDFGVMARRSLQNDYPVVCHVNPYNLPNYMEEDRDKGHHVVVKGYIIQTGNGTTTYMMYYVDPHYSSAHNGVYATTMENMLFSINERASWYVAMQ